MGCKGELYNVYYWITEESTHRIGARLQPKDHTTAIIETRVKQQKCIYIVGEIYKLTRVHSKASGGIIQFL